MAEETTHPGPNKNLLAIGAVVAGGGLYFVLVGLSALPPPSRTNAPGWVVMCCGLAFAAAGFAVLVRGWLGVPDSEGDLPQDAPVALKAIYSFSGVGAAAALALVGSWVAFGPGERHFSMSGPIVGPVGDALGRAIFGIGAVLTWIAVALFARAAARKVFGKKQA
jgi:hypothetical protein